MAETKICEACDQEIGSTETTCPKCGVVFADLEEQIQAVERASTIAAKRKAAKLPPTTAPETPKKKTGAGIFGGLGGK